MTSSTLRAPEPFVGRASEIDQLHTRIVAAFAEGGVGTHDCDLDALAESVLAEAIRIAVAWVEGEG